MIFYDKNEKKYREKSKDEIERDLSLLKILDDENENGDCDQTIPLEKRNNGNKDDYNNDYTIENINCKHQDNNIYQKDKPENNNISMNDKKLFEYFNYESKKLKHLLQNGYLSIPDRVLFHIISTKNCSLSYNELSLFLFLYRKTRGFHRNSWKVDIAEIHKNLNINKVYIYELIKKLISKGYIIKKNNIIWYNDDNFVDIGRKGFTPIPDYLLLSLINKDYIKTKYELIIYLYFLKRSFGYNEYNIQYKTKYTPSKKRNDYIEREKIGDIKEWFFLQNGYRDIMDKTNIDRHSLSKTIKKIISKGFIQVENSDYIWVKVKYNINEWIS